MLVKFQTTKFYQSLPQGMTAESADPLLVASSSAFCDTVFHVNRKCIYSISEFIVVLLLIELQKAILGFLRLPSSSGAVHYIMAGVLQETLVLQRGKRLIT